MQPPFPSSPPSDGVDQQGHQGQFFGVGDQGTSKQSGLAWRSADFRDLCCGFPVSVTRERLCVTLGTVRREVLWCFVVLLFIRDFTTVDNGVQETWQRLYPPALRGRPSEIVLLNNSRARRVGYSAVVVPA